MQLQKELGGGGVFGYIKDKGKEKGTAHCRKKTQEEKGQYKWTGLQR